MNGPQVSIACVVVDYFSGTLVFGCVILSEHFVM
jgi:hypothetical protein